MNTRQCHHGQGHSCDHSPGLQARHGGASDPDVPAGLQGGRGGEEEEELGATEEGHQGHQPCQGEDQTPALLDHLPPCQVRIHNIRSGRPEPEIEILYAVYEDKKEPILAIDAVRVVEENVDQDQAVLLLGHSLKIKAEREQRFGD